MKKLLLCLILGLLVGCTVQTVPTSDLDKFIECYYEVTPELVEELKNFHVNAPNDDTRADYLSKEEELPIYAIKEVCSEDFKNRFFNGREYSKYTSKFDDLGIDYLEVKESNYKEDYESGEYMYYLHETKIDIHYEDGSTKEVSVEGRICFQIEEKVVHTYKISKDLDL